MPTLIHRHPFDSYGQFTDIQALKEASARPLRPSLRVNTVKCTVEECRKWSEERGWILTPVPWCEEGFFVDRTSEEAFGKDLLHQLGALYIQEAASMLPVALLGPEPGETILDLCSAPGSKTTQIAAKMCSHGVIVANDPQESRLWVLKQALHRSGVTNVIVTKKVGQWFSKHMTERFDRVLCDAPCTAQGTVRKDAGALAYSSEARVGKMARLQEDLLESAIHAAKIGGRIVYSTCTLTPEENEGVVRAILGKFAGKVETVDPREELGIRNQELGNMLDKAIEDSHIVQKQFLIPNSYFLIPALRLWPQTYDTEGFFSAVLRKTARTKDPLPMDAVPFQEAPVSLDRTRQIARILEEEFGTSFLREGDRLFARGEHLSLATEEIAAFPLPVQDYALGLPFGTIVAPDYIRLKHELVTLRGGMATRQVHAVTEKELEALLQGNDIPCPRDLHGDILLRFRSFMVGIGGAKDGRIKNRLPRQMIRQSN